MRLIDADVFKENMDFICDAGGWLEPVTKAVREFVKKHIDIQTTVNPDPHWIPVDLRNNSPEENKVVLLGVRFRDDFKYFVTSRQDYNYWTGLGRGIKGELRWQPLPEPYQPKEDES